MSLYFDNNKLFDAEGHLTDDGLYALKDGTLDDLGALEAAEHLSFCDYCLLRYTAMIEAAPECMKQPMRDLIPQVQALMRLRSFRIMTHRYVSAAAAVVLLFLSSALEELTDFLRELAGNSGVSLALFGPLYKTVAIALVVKVGAGLCRDAGESALASVVETAGAVCALLVSLPLLRAVLELLMELMG